MDQTTPEEHVTNSVPDKKPMSGGLLQSQIKELRTQLAAALEINKRYESELKRMKKFEEQVDPKAGSGPQCQASRLHRAEECESLWTGIVETKLGPLSLCTRHAHLFTGKGLPDTGAEGPTG